MKVLQLIDSLEVGGAERMAVHIANALSKKEVSSYICSTSRTGPLEDFIDPKVSLYILHKRRTIDIPAIRRFLKFLQKEQISIIHAHATSIQLASLAKVCFPKLKIVWHDHYGLSNEIHRRPRIKMRIIAPLIDTTIAVNDILAQWSRDILNIKNVSFISNFSSSNELIAPITQLYGTKGKRVVCLANLRPQKNHIALIEAFQLSLEKHADWTLHLIGKDFKDPYSESVKQIIVERKLENQVFTYGSRLDVSHILQQTSIGVLASISEGLPLSLIEYGLHKLPAISTRVGQCAQVLGSCGVLIDTVREEMSRALVSLYNSTPEEREKMGYNLYNRVQSEYSEEAFMSKLLPIYKDLVP